MYIIIYEQFFLISSNLISI